MNAKKLKTKDGLDINGPLLINPSLYKDERGFFMESWNMKEFNEKTFEDIIFVQDNHSKSIKNVLRGLHYQSPPYEQGKLVRCINGEIFDVAVDIRKESETYGSWVFAYLNSVNKNQLWIPEGFAHGFLCLSDKCIVHYKCSEYRHKESETTLNWRDKTIKIKWPIKKPILSKKDKIGKNLEFFR